LIAINLSGITMTENLNNLGLETDQVVRVIHVEKYDDNEKALSVVDEMNNLIGWIPKLETIEKYGKEAIELGDQYKIDMQRQRWADTSFIRDNIITDMFRNHIEVQGKICRLQTDFETGDIISVSVMFNYM